MSLFLFRFLLPIPLNLVIDWFPLLPLSLIYWRDEQATELHGHVYGSYNSMNHH
jgi:hypothetical protein